MNFVDDKVISLILCHIDYGEVHALFGRKYVGGSNMTGPFGLFLYKPGVFNDKVYLQRNVPMGFEELFDWCGDHFLHKYGW